MTILNMASEFIEIKSPHDLVEALGKARKIEEAFEEVLHWQGFLTITDRETGEILGRLVRESETHEHLVDSLIRMVGPSVPTGQETRSALIVIDGDSEVQFLQKLLEGEDLAYYVYSAILDSLGHLDQQSIGGEQNAVEMRRVLRELVSAEKMHRELVSGLLAARSPP